MSALLRDLRFALRSLRKAPGFTLVAVLTLGLGIGANAAIFSVVNGALLRPLPYDRPEQLTFVGHRYTGTSKLETGVSARGYLFYRDQNRVFAHSAAATGWDANFSGAGEPERLIGSRVTADYFTTLGVQLLLGRTFLAEEEQPEADRVVVLSEGLWLRAFGRDPAIVGRTIAINGEGHRVVGVAAHGLAVGDDPEIFKPLAFRPDQLNCWGCEWMAMIARIKPDLTPTMVDTDLARVSALAREQQAAGRDKNWALYQRSVSEAVVGDIRPALVVLMGAVGFVLLIACANLANLLLARGQSRRREMAIRTAMGAGRSRLLRQLLTECLVLAAAGAAAGLVFAGFAIRALPAIGPGSLTRLGTIAIDGRVLVFTAAVSIAIAVLFGLVPALELAQGKLFGAIKDGARAVGGTGAHRLRAALIVAEVALALILLVGATLMIKSFERWTAVDPGFVPDRVLTVRLQLPEARYPTPERRAAFYERLLREVRALPGVSQAGGIVALPMTGDNWTQSFRVEGFEPGPDGRTAWGDFRIASAGYFEALGIPVRKGRAFEHGDDLKGRRVAIVDEVLALTYWAGQDPIGKRVGLPGRDSTLWYDVVGVVGHVIQSGPRDDRRTQLYLSTLQRPEARISLAIKTPGDPLSLVQPVRRTVLGIDPTQPIFDEQPMDALVSRSSSQPRFTMLLLGAFAGLAVLLAGVGIYGVMSYTVAQQTREIGVRLALGAEQRSVLRMVLSRGMSLAGLGVAIGVGGALAIGRLLANQLFQVRPSDPIVLGGVALGLLGVALMATYFPARRATGVDPIVAMRND